MGMRRLSRLTNAFSKKLENHVAAWALHFIHGTRIQQTLPVTPAWRAPLIGGIKEIISLLARPADQDNYPERLKAGRWFPPIESPVPCGFS
jgi:hypothetical protein